MKIQNLTEASLIYTANVYLVTGSWNALSDVNTLIDVGRDPAIIEKLMSASTGIGKTRVEQVVLTHSHYDHASFLSRIRELFHPKVYAFATALEGVDHYLTGGEVLKIGDQFFEVVHIAGHSHDSICLYCKEERVLFAGDAPLIFQSPNNDYEEQFIVGLKSLAKQAIETIYFGHGQPMKSGCHEALMNSVKNLK